MANDNTCSECGGGEPVGNSQLPLLSVPMLSRSQVGLSARTIAGFRRQPSGDSGLANDPYEGDFERAVPIEEDGRPSLTGPTYLAESTIMSGSLTGLSLSELGIVQAQVGEGTDAAKTGEISDDELKGMINGGTGKDEDSRYTNPAAQKNPSSKQEWLQGKEPKEKQKRPCDENFVQVTWNRVAVVTQKFNQAFFAMGKAAAESWCAKTKAKVSKDIGSYAKDTMGPPRDLKEQLEKLVKEEACGKYFECEQPCECSTEIVSYTASRGTPREIPGSNLPEDVAKRITTTCEVKTRDEFSKSIQGGMDSDATVDTIDGGEQSYGKIGYVIVLRIAFKRVYQTKLVFNVFCKEVEK